ncbi:hypothetical protein G4B88_020075 [Cannabis sativa]|uniref:Uncharacterized protein n=1 Tax=Cannabis sativa TaxID=3483 RepID=A0A7J6GLJ4_CANSA|nr:hypothetical protein G4B88_020075 [Cannabis sativa]
MFCPDVNQQYQLNMVTTYLEINNRPYRTTDVDDFLNIYGVSLPKKKHFSTSTHVLVFPTLIANPYASINIIMIIMPRDGDDKLRAEVGYAWAAEN